MKNTKAALAWITEILQDHHIPFQIAGGLAARAYGATRELADIDIDIPEQAFPLLQREVAPFIVFWPQRFQDENWDLFLMTLNYAGQDIDVGGAHDSKIFNKKTNNWEPVHVDFANVEMHNLYGLSVPVIALPDLLAYKRKLGRDVDLLDIKELEQANNL